MTVFSLDEIDAPASGPVVPSTGRPILPNADGSVSTELSITVTDPRLNGGRPTNIPSIWNGRELDEDSAVQAALQSGQTFQSFGTIDDAVKAAQARSAALGQEIQGISAPTVQPQGGATFSIADIDAVAPAPERGFFQQLIPEGINRGIANVVGLPGDAVNAALRGLGASRDVIPGSRDVQGGIASLNMAPVPGQEPPDTLTTRIGQETGAALAALPLMLAKPLQGALQAQRAGAPLTSMQDAAMTAARNPIRTVAGETTIATGAGAGREVAARLEPGSEGAEALGAIAGGVATAATPSVVKYGPVGLLARGTVSLIRKSIFPFTTQGATIRAENRMQSLARDPALAADRAGASDTLSEAPLSPAQRTGDPNLLALENAVLENDARLQGVFAERMAEANQIIRNAARDVGGADGEIAKTRDFYEQRRAYLLGLLDTRAQNAAALAEQRILQLIPTTGRGEANMIVRDEIERALSDARTQERQLWQAIPENQRVRLTNTRAAIQKVISSRSEASDPGEIPPFITELFGTLNEKGKFEAGSLGNAARVRVLDDARSRINRAVREEKAAPAPNWNRVRLLNDVDEAILNDLGVIEGKSETGRLISDALAFSRTLNEKFTRGPVGRILGYEAKGGPAVADELTLETTVGRGGPRAGVETQAILNATQGTGDNQTPGAIEQFLRDDFFRRSAPTGRDPSPERARYWLTQNTEALDRFPGLRAEIQEVAEGGERARSAAARLQRARTAFNDPNRTAAARILNAPVDQEIARVLKARDPAAEMQTLVRQASRDPSGNAVKGLRAGLIDNWIGQAETGIADDAGEVFLSGRRLRKFLQDNADLVKATFPDAGDRERLSRIATTAARVEAAAVDRAKPNIGGIINDAPSTLLSMITRTVAARLGAQAGSGTSGASLLTANFASRQARELLGRFTNDKARQLLIDAVQDPELFRTLLIDTSSPRRQQVVKRRLNAWLAGPTAQAIDAISPEEEQPEVPVR